MAMKLLDGDYVPDEWGGFETVTGEEEMLQRICFKLKARRGAFPLMPDLGSRLYLLTREKETNRKNAARQYIHEALADETELEIDTIDLYENDGELMIRLVLRYSGDVLKLSLTV